MLVCRGFHGSLYQVFSVGIAEMVIICVVLCSHIGVYQCFVGICSLQLKDYVQIWLWSD